eukprot:5279817-Prymnesium_polylepis.1
MFARRGSSVLFLQVRHRGYKRAAKQVSLTAAPVSHSGSVVGSACPRSQASPCTASDPMKVRNATLWRCTQP